MTETELRRQLVAHAQDMHRRALSAGTSGNLSVRVSEGMLITPSGVPYASLQPEDMVLVHPDGSWHHRLPPSSEWHFHRDIYLERPEVHAVVHAHPIHCTTLAIRQLPIPAVHYMIAVSGGSEIRCAPYATYGTPELSRLAVEALRGRTACLLANHGMIAVGPDLGKALWIALEVETLAQQYVLSLQIGGPVLLPDEEIERVIEKFKDYGPRSREDSG